MAFALSRLRALRGLTQFPVGSRSGGPGDIRQRTRRGSKGFTLIELLIVVAIIGILAAIAIPNLLQSQKRAKYSRAASDTKTAVAQAIVYQNDTNRYPGDFARLRDSGYANVPDLDPWGLNYVVSALFADTALPPTAAPELHACSEGPNGAAGDCDTAAMTSVPVGAPGGGVGYSAMYGGWSGS